MENSIIKAFIDTEVYNNGFGNFIYIWVVEDVMKKSWLTYATEEEARKSADDEADIVYKVPLWLD